MSNCEYTTEPWTQRPFKTTTDCWQAKELVHVDMLGLQTMDMLEAIRLGAPSMQTAVSLAYQGVVVLNLLHCRLSCQGKLDDLKMVQLLRGRSTARNKQSLCPSAHIVHKHRDMQKSLVTS